MPVRPARLEDRAAAIALMVKLWPDAQELDFEPAEMFVWEREDGSLGGFASFSIRPFVDGCESRPCPHVEGWWVDEDLRRQGIGAALIGVIEDWARDRGFTELGSDTLLSNGLSRTVHPRLGFEPTEQIQYFRKALG
jgi:aminoglycoside 6'-N-acetyltransferase I